MSSNILNYGPYEEYNLKVYTHELLEDTFSDYECIEISNRRGRYYINLTFNTSISKDGEYKLLLPGSDRAYHFTGRGLNKLSEILDNEEFRLTDHIFRTNNIAFGRLNKDNVKLHILRIPADRFFELNKQFAI